MNLDPLAAQEGLAIVPDSVHLPETFPIRDLLVDADYVWATGRNYVRLEPGQGARDAGARRAPAAARGAGEEEVLP